MKAISLLSGGLDSTLATKLALEQGLEVIALNFTSPFCQCNHKANSCSIAKDVAQGLGVSLNVVNLGTEYLEIVKNPKHGYGSNMNPCVDCRILMLKKAKEFMQKNGADFIITGEVLGQRPMSQYRHMLKLIDKETQLEGLILRPLSANLLDETIPEKKGWVNRKLLLSLSGRTRKPQISLAKDRDIKNYSCPAGGCLLTDPGFSKRMKDLIKYCGSFSLRDVELLKLGRHFRLDVNSKLIVGRDESENNRLKNFIDPGDIYFDPHPVKGPVAIGRGNFKDNEILELGARIIARYCDKNGTDSVIIKYGSCPDITQNETSVFPLELEKIELYRI